MTDELLQTAVLGVAATLLAFELVVAARSLHDASRTEPERSAAAPWLGRTNHGQLLISEGFAIRGHLTERRFVTNALRRQYAELGTNHHGRQLRGAIGRVRLGPAAIAAGCPSCRTARLKGQGRCLDCGRRLIGHAAPADG
jgi:hypothetical protein